MITRRNPAAEPDYFRKPYPDNDALYTPRFEFLLPLFCKAYRYDDERRTRYQDYATNYITGIFGTEDNIKKPYMKRMGNYTIITDPNRFVRDYNAMVEGLQEWCRIHHITYRAIGEPDTRIYKLSELYEDNKKWLRQAEVQYEKWDKLRTVCEELTVEPESIKIGSWGTECFCFKDSDDDRHSWHIHFHSVGHIGEYRLAIDTKFDCIENVFHPPVQLPAVHIKLYLTLLDDYFSNPWAEINNTYPIRADQISKKCRKTICKYIYSAIEEFDQKNPKELLSYDMEESWGHNFFRLIKEDFNPVDDIRILFEDGKIINHYSDIDPKEAVEKYKKVSEEIEPYLK